jgi:hypothetical protein
MKKLITIYAIICFSLGFVSCTAQQRAKKYGGSATVNIPADKKLVIATWKGDNLWLMTRPRKEGETPETYFFQESSSWGVFEGTITIKEK